MRVLIFDTETNGLPTTFRAPPEEEGAWPALVQLAWETWEVPSRDGEGASCVQSHSTLVRPKPGVAWSEGAEGVHGISEAVATRFGVPTTSALSLFLLCAQCCDVVVAHNLHFDLSVVRSALLHECAGGGVWPAHLREFCTMLGTVGVVRAPHAAKPQWRRQGDESFKWPKMTELHAHLFEGREYSPPAGHPAESAGAHDARYDTGAVAACLVELLRRDLGGAREALFGSTTSDS